MRGWRSTHSGLVKYGWSRRPGLRLTQRPKKRRNRASARSWISWPEGLAEGVRRLTDGYGADIIVDGVGGEILAAAIETLEPGGSLITLGYAASRKSTIDVTNLTWKEASIKGFLLFSEPASAWEEAWAVITKLLKSGEVKPIVAKTFPLEAAAEALRFLVEERPFGRVLVTM